MIDLESTPISDADLISRAVEGDLKAFGHLYERYVARIYRYVYYMVMDHPEAEDLTENVFLKAWKALPGLRLKEVAFRSWLYRIARNLVIDTRRARKSTLSLDRVTGLPDDLPAPESTVEAGETQKALAVALTQLKPQFRQVLVCRFVSGLSHGETAEALGISEANVRVIQYRALKEMQHLLRDKRE